MSVYTLPIILPLLEKPENGTLEFIINELYKNSKFLTQSEQEHVCARLNNLLKNYNLYNNFYAIKIINVLIFNHEILSAHGSEFFVNIIKVISNVNNFNDDNKAVKVVLKTAIECIKTLLQETRGKPALMRDVVTPNLPSFIGALIQSIDITPLDSIKLLYQIIQTNTTTFRPFGAKFEKKLISILDNNFKTMSETLQQFVCKSLVLCKFILTQKNNEESFQKFFNELLLDIKSVLQIYENFIDVENSENLLQNLNKISGQEVGLFSPLKIDSNDAATIFAINERLSILTQILICTFKTNHNFKISLGSVILIDETLLSFNLDFIHLKREFKFIDLKNILYESISQVQRTGVYLLSKIAEEFEGSLVPHFNSLISSLEYSIPVLKAGTIDKARILRDEELIRDIISNASKLLSLTSNYTDYPMLNKLIESTFVLTETRTPEQPTAAEQQQKQNGKKHKKQKTTASLSDLISHGNLFVKETPIETKRVLNDFYKALICNVSLPATKKTKIVKYALVELLIFKTKSDLTLIELLRSMLLNPTHDSVNVLPFVSEILANDDELLSLFINPRLPPLQQTVKFTEQVEEQEEEDDEEEDQEAQEEQEASPKRRKLSDEEQVEIVKSTKIEPKVIESKYQDEIFTKPDEEKIVLQEEIEKVVVVVDEKKSEVDITNSITNDDDDDESDIEIPDIEMSSDDED